MGLVKNVSVGDPRDDEWLYTQMCQNVGNTLTRYKDLQYQLVSVCYVGCASLYAAIPMAVPCQTCCCRGK